MIVLSTWDEQGHADTDLRCHAFVTVFWTGPAGSSGPPGTELLQSSSPLAQTVNAGCAVMAQIGKSQPGASLSGCEKTWRGFIDLTWDKCIDAGYGISFWKYRWNKKQLWSLIFKLKIWLQTLIVNLDHKKKTNKTIFKKTHTHFSSDCSVWFSTKYIILCLSTCV